VDNILFRADSSSTIGTGHIMRDLVLAAQYKEANITFAVQALQGNINHKIEEQGYTIEVLDSNDLEELDALIKRLNIEMIIIDHYSIDEAYEKQLKVNNPVLKIMVLDDTYEKHHCDILLNHNIYADADKYRGLVSDHCELRCGEKYTLLRDEFLQAKKEHPTKSSTQANIFIAMGGTDVANLNIEILGQLRTFQNIHVDLITTSANPNLEQLKDHLRNSNWITLHIDTTKMATLLAKSDLAIVTPSVTLNEVWYMNVPFIAIQVAENQSFMREFLFLHNKNILNEFNHITLKEKLEKVLTYGV